MDIYEYYNTEFKGKLSEDIINNYENQAIDIIDMYVRSKCLNKEKLLHEYGDFKKAICYEVELLHQTGIESVNGGSGKNDITAIKTNNYDIQVSASRRNQFVWRGLPLHVISKSLIDNELRKNGFSSQVL